MAFEGLSEKLQNAFKDLRGQGVVSEKDFEDAMRVVKMALLEADVNFKVVKDFVADVKEKALGQGVLKSLTPDQMVVKIVKDELVEMIFKKDLEEVKKADILFFLLDGRAPDEGASVELGMAYAYGKRCYGFKTDTRAVENGLDLNPMIAGALIKLFKDFDGDKAIASLEEYLADHRL